MDQVFMNLFQNGQNNGEITFIGADGETIKCHKTVLENTTNFQQYVPAIIKLNHHSKHIKLALAQLYDSNYLIKNRDELCRADDPETIMLDEKSRTAIAILKIIDVGQDLKINYWVKQTQMIPHLFERSITVDNWVALMIRILGIAKYKFLLDSIIPKIKEFIYLTDSSTINPEIMNCLSEIYDISLEPFHEDGDDFYYLVNYSRKEYITVSKKNGWSQCQAIVRVLINHSIWQNSDDVEIEPFYNDEINKSELDKQLFSDVSHHLNVYKQQRLQHEKN